MHSANPLPLITVAFGTRPEAIKLAPVVRALEGRARLRLLLTGQHASMVDDLLEPLGLHPDIRLNVMRERQTLNGLCGRLLSGLEQELVSTRPAALIVQGDTSSALCAALAAFHEHVPVAHVEAGLRSFDADNPFPEEVNRRLITTLARWHFAPTSRSQQNLLDENVSAGDVVVTGNTAIDSLLWARGSGAGRSAFTNPSAHGRVLVTLHRRESQGPRMRSLAVALGTMARERNLDLVLPMHRSPVVREALRPALEGNPNVHLVDPLGYFDFAATLAEAHVVVTDSGGVQEEAPALGVPVLVARETTERAEAVESGCARLVGTDPERVAKELGCLLDDERQYLQMQSSANPFGDGRAAERIATRLTADLCTPETTRES